MMAILFKNIALPFILCAASVPFIYSFHIQRYVHYHTLCSNNEFESQKVLSANGAGVVVSIGKYDRRTETTRRFLSSSTSNNDGNPSSAAASDVSSSTTATSTPTTAANSVTPQFDGKRVLPYKVIVNGLKGNQQYVAAVYAIYNSNYLRGSDGWEATTYVGVTQDLLSTLQTLYMNDITELKVSHCRILSFTYPEPNAMQEVANQWRQNAVNANAQLEAKWADDVLNYMFENEDDDDDDDDFDMEMMGDAMAMANGATPSTIVSPFASSNNNEVGTENASSESSSVLTFNLENVDTVLNEVRPYLIADGGNVKVVNVDGVEKKVYLQLQGACGSCASSTITMQMGIERILREKFPSLVEVIKIEDGDTAPKELSDYEAMVEVEIQRIRPAITAMGGNIQMISVDSETGMVMIQFRGSRKVQQGVELAILDIDFVKEVQFVDE